MTATTSRSETKAAVREPLDEPSVDSRLHARFEREVSPLRNVLYRHAFRISQNHADAEDLVQETMMRAYVHFDSFRSGTKVKAWLLRIMTNTNINGYRQKRRRPVHYAIEQVTDQHLAEAAAHSAASALQSAEDRALELLPDGDIKTAMLALPRQFREAVYYADVAGLRYDEIAAVMNTPRGTVMSRLHRGRRQLRALLGSASAVGPEAPASAA